MHEELRDKVVYILPPTAKSSGRAILPFELYVVLTVFSFLPTYNAELVTLAV